MANKIELDEKEAGKLGESSMASQVCLVVGLMRFQQEAGDSQELDDERIARVQEGIAVIRRRQERIAKLFEVCDI